MAQCPVCGETKLDGWTVCPACGHPYPVEAAPAEDDRDDDDGDDHEDDEDDDD